MFNRIRKFLGIAEAPTQGDAHRSSGTFTGQSADDPPSADAPHAPDVPEDGADESDWRDLPAESYYTIETERFGSVVVATFTDSRILDDRRIRNTGHALDSLLEDTVKGVLLDFRHVEFISSAMLGKLILLRKRCLSHSIELRLCSISPAIYEVFEVTRLSQIFVVDPDRTASLSRLLAPEGFPFPSSEADWLVCADWWEERGHELIAKACRAEANRCGASRTAPS